MVGLKDGIPGAVLAIHTFGSDPTKFHPHLHVLSTNGLFKDTGTFYMRKNVDLKPLEEIFRAELFRFLKREGKITDELINKLMKWRRSGFSQAFPIGVKETRCPLIMANGLKKTTLRGVRLLCNT